MENKEKAIKLMMQVNDFDPMDESPTDENNPFIEKVDTGKGLDKEFYGFRKEKKHWEERNPEEDEFKEVTRNKE